MGTWRNPGHHAYSARQRCAVHQQLPFPMHEHPVSPQLCLVGDIRGAWFCEGRLPPPDAVSLCLAALVPQAMGKALLEVALSLGRTLSAAPLGPLAAWQRAQLGRIFATGRTLRLQFPAEDLGFVYARGAVQAEGAPGGSSGGHGAHGTPVAAAAASAARGAAYAPSSAPGESLDVAPNAVVGGAAPREENLRQMLGLGC